MNESWIADKVQLIPRMKTWVATNYPGTKTGITEYNWGAEGHMNGALAQADIFGIFGREGLDLGDALGDAGYGHADLYGDEIVPQLRREQVRFWRYERGRDRAKSG